MQARDMIYCNCLSYEFDLYRFVGNICKVVLDWMMGLGSNSFPSDDK